MTSDRTKKMRKGYWITFLVSLALNFIPLIVFVIMGFVKGEPKEKLTLGFTIVIALALTATMLLMKAHLKRTVFWVLLLGVVCCLNKLQYMFIVMAICNILDEIIITPLHNGYKTKLKTNKEIDRRM